MTPRISDDAIACMAPDDAAREQRIRAAGEQLLLAQTSAARRTYADSIAAEVRGRSPAAIAIIEADKGLR